MVKHLSLTSKQVKRSLCRDRSRRTGLWMGVAIGILAFPTVSFAADFSSVLAAQNGVTVSDSCSAGYCSVTNGVTGMLKTSQVQTLQNNWVSEINTMGESISAALEAQTSAMARGMTAVATNFNTMLKSLIPALLSAGYAAPKGVPHIAPLAGCSAPEISKQLGDSLGNVAATRAVFDQLSARYNNSTVSHTAAVQRIAQASPTALSPDTLLPPPLTASAAYPSAQDVGNYVSMLTNPLPAVQLTSGQLSTPAGIEWRAAVKSQQNAQTLAQSALDWLAGGTQPTMDAAPFQSLWTLSKMEGPMPGVAASAPGMSGPAISRNASLQMVANSFYANPKFQQGLTQATQVELMDNADILLNVVSEQDDQSLQALQYWAALLAHRYMTSTEGGSLSVINDAGGLARMQRIAN